MLKKKSIEFKDPLSKTKDTIFNFINDYKKNKAKQKAKYEKDLAKQKKKDLALEKKLEKRQNKMKLKRKKENYYFKRNS